MPDHVLLLHFHYGPNKEATLFLDISSGGSFSHKTIREGKVILDKILENTPYTGVHDEFPKEDDEPSLEPKEEEHATKLEISIDSSHDLVVEKPPIEGTQNKLEDDETFPLELPFEFEEDILEDYGNTSNLPVQARPLARPSSSDLHEESVHIEHIKNLSLVTSYEWLREAKLSPEVAQIISPSTILLCQVRGSAMKIHYNRSIEINFISKALAKTLYPNTSLTPSRKLLQSYQDLFLKAMGSRVVPFIINNLGICLDFHIFDILEIPLLIGKPIMRPLLEKPL
jgi:hypothetical protein